MYCYCNPASTFMCNSSFDSHQNPRWAAKTKIKTKLIWQILTGFIMILGSDSSLDQKLFRVSFPTTWTGYIYSQQKGKRCRKNRNEVQRQPHWLQHTFILFEHGLNSWPLKMSRDTSTCYKSSP